jgi:hypothetical protein
LAAKGRQVKTRRDAASVNSRTLMRSKQEHRSSDRQDQFDGDHDGDIARKSIPRHCLFIRRRREKTL